MVPGSDLRQYRRKLGRSQRQVADLLRVSQATLSMIESDKLSLSPALYAKFAKEFNKPRYKPQFDAFFSRLEAERRSHQTLVGHPDVTYQLLPVWEWEDGFDLGSPPSSLESRGFVATRTFEDDAIAFQMPKGSSWWAEGEILVFVRFQLKECRTGDLCLVQARPPRARAARTSLAIVRREGGRSSAGLLFEPCDPSQPAFAPDPQSIEGLLKCVYRARYLV